ncbi:MAG: hypothetical protein A3C44_00755 [Gammaproteobacteria bacterium RIFCSPHIGHO2_02_FULL_39_13]|nr:MAG: hypothetical protein A3C44_00755 [Gammaproteobacteria bacterium RIFCSPHIGHO2_02_FULL_39_13]OGT49898.1 MAG: hypothetical protein A3E53_02960 [Gammaproteobacteria bacterium RIFCSPHIGHO2_12_FULL_39_24]
MKENIFGIHGGGNIGLGLMADVINRSEKKYHIVATSNDVLFNQFINTRNRLHLQHEHGITTEISNIRMISRDSVAVIDLYAHATVLAICLTPNAFNEESVVIARGMIERYEKTKKPLTILLLMNLPDCLNLVRASIAKKISGLLLDDETKTAAILEGIKMVATVPDRVVTKIPAEEIFEKLKLDILEKLPSEKHPVILPFFSEPRNHNNAAKIIEIAHQYQLDICLYRAEKGFRLYAPEYLLNEFGHFSGIHFVKDIAQLETIKNKYINGPHTILAWLGGILGCKTIAESFQYPGMKYYIKRLMHEIAEILKKTYLTLTDKELAGLQDLFFNRCETSDADPVSRVGRNPLSKLDRFGRVIGSISLRKGFYLTHLPCLEMGIAAGVVYALQNQDMSDKGCNVVKEIFHSNGQSYTAILCHDDKNEHRGLDLIKDNGLIMRILRNIEFLLRTPQRLMEAQPLVHQLRLFTNPSTIKRNVMRSFLGNLNINIDFNTGRLSYGKDFAPLNLDYELIFVRHGETYGNAGLSDRHGKIDPTAIKGISNNRVFQGNVDEDINQLTEYGEEQARIAAHEMFDSGLRPDIIFHSPLQRAKKTGIPFIELLRSSDVDCEYVELSTIREMSFGMWENRRVSDMPSEHACHQFYRQQNALIKEDGANVHGNFCQAENFYDVMLRAHQTLTSLNEKYSRRKILMYSHSMFGAACCILMGIGNEIAMGNEKYLAFDGTGIMPYCKPILLSRLKRESVPRK